MKKKKGNRTERRLNSAIKNLSERDKKLMERYAAIKLLSNDKN